jgi:hypothetical protein
VTVARVWPDRLQVIQGFFQSEVFQVIAEDLQAQEGGELLVHTQHGIFAAGAQHEMAMVHPFQDGGELPSDSLVETKAEQLRELVGGEAEQSEVAGALEELMDGEVASEDEVATVFDLLQGVMAEAALRACELIVAGDQRIGKVPGTRRVSLSGVKKAAIRTKMPKRSTKGRART